jgi:hypothetical protein
MATINVRNIDREVAESIGLAAAARGQTYAQFLTLTLDLVKRAQARAEFSPDIRRLLEDVGLQEVVR